jgi:hypothetical protein
MANNKNQHFVPKCHLRPFSESRNKADINLFNIKSETFVRNASIRGQCARDYIYGNDQKLENIFQNFEGNYATIVRAVNNGTPISNDDLEFLLRFMHLQYYRTVMAVQRMDDGIEGMRDEIYRDRGNKPNEAKPDEKQRTLMSLKFCFSSLHLIEDLKVCIFDNISSNEIFTSDDPVIFTNKYSFQRLRQSSFGLINSGFMYIMPLSPKAAVMAYDGGVYTIDGKVGCKVYIDDRSDIEALNELQYLKAQNNIYLPTGSFVKKS